jgi:diguanylate cyclase (GGDEF)-like protein
MESVLDESTLRASLPLLDLLPEPAMWIATDFRVLWRNERARQVYGEDSSYCYALSHGLDHPCAEAGEACPKVTAESTLRPFSEVHAHFENGVPELFRVLALPVTTGGVLELHLSLGSDLIRDELTGLFRREYWYEIVRRGQALLSRLSRPFSLILLDLDDFKGVNDRFGHLAGDDMLREVGACLIESMRSSDAACRYGGEEMVLFLPDSEAGAAREVAERIRRAVKAIRIPTEVGDVRVTMSAGICTTAARTPLEVALDKVDRALYRAKDRGRDRIVVSE